MQVDLIELEITKGELRRFTGFKPEQVLRSSIMENSEQRLEFFRNEMLLSFVFTLITVGFCYAFIILPTIGSSTILLLIVFIIVFVTVITGRWLWRRLAFPQTLRILLDTVDKYHTVIQAIDMTDQALDEKSESMINDREKVISALRFVREDLVQALKTDRIVRERKKLPPNYQDLSTNHLTNLHALQLSENTSEYTQLLEQILQIALDLQALTVKL